MACISSVHIVISNSILRISRIRYGTTGNWQEKAITPGWPPNLARQRKSPSKQQRAPSSSREWQTLPPISRALNSKLRVEQIIGVNRKNLQPDVYRDIITSRRSIRQFKNAPVPRDVIEQVLDLARYAPTASNDQNVGYIVVTDKHLIEETANTIFGFTHRKKPGSRPTTATLPQQPSSIMLMPSGWELV